MRPAAAAGLVAVVAVLASSCGGGGKASVAATTATTTFTTAGAAQQAAAEKALFTYAACMRGKGVDIPDPVRGANGRYAFPHIPAKVLNAPGVRAKAQACAAKLPRGSFRQGGAQSPAQRAAFQKFTACMRANGVTFGRPGGQQGRPRQDRVKARPASAGAFRSFLAKARGRGKDRGKGPAGAAASSTPPTRK